MKLLKVRIVRNLSMLSFDIVFYYKDEHIVDLRNLCVPSGQRKPK